MNKFITENKVQSIVEKTAAKSNFSLKQNIMLQLIEKYGKDAQVIQTLEEMSELQKELIKNINRGADNRKEILAEFIDLRFMLEQIKVIYDFTDSEIQNMDEEKLAKAAKNL